VRIVVRFWQRYRYARTTIGWGDADGRPGRAHALWLAAFDFSLRHGEVGVSETEREQGFIRRRGTRCERLFGVVT
jgi:hypothetical protein